MKHPHPRYMIKREQEMFAKLDNIVEKLNFIVTSLANEKGISLDEIDTVIGDIKTFTEEID